MKILPVCMQYSQKCAVLPFKALKADIISDIKQKDEYSCAPAAAANSVIHLTHNQTNQDLLVSRLAYLMKTDTKGTTTNNLCKGLSEYLNANGFNAVIKYSGFRETDDIFKTEELPDIEKIKTSIKNGDAIILNLGIYKKFGDIYLRQYGHFVNAVDFENDVSFLITDPYDKNNTQNYIKLSRLNEGKLIHNKDDNEIALTDNAEGFYEILSGINYLKPDEIAIINGAVTISKK